MQDTRVRTILSIVLVPLTALSFVAAIVGVWTRSVVLDTDSWMGIVRPALASQEFKSELSERLSGAAIEALDIEDRLGSRLAALDDYLSDGLIEALDLGPRAQEILGSLDLPKFEDLADPVASAVNESITSVTDGLVSSKAFEQTIDLAVRNAHAAFVTLATEDVGSLDNLYLRDSELRWNAIPLVVDVIGAVVDGGVLPELAQISLPDLSDNPLAAAAISRLSTALSVQLPDDFGQVTVMSEDQYDALRSAAGAFEQLVWLLVATFVVFLGVTLWVSRDRLRTTLQLLVAGFVAVVGALLIVRRLTESIRDAIVDPGTVSAIGEFLDVTTSRLRSDWLTVVAVAMMAALSLLAAGHRGWIGVRTTSPSMERFDGFLARHSQGSIVVAIALALLALWQIGIGLVSTIVVIALLALAVRYVLTASTTMTEGSSAGTPSG